APLQHREDRHLLVHWNTRLRVDLWRSRLTRCPADLDLLLGADPPLRRRSHACARVQCCLAFLACRGGSCLMTTSYRAKHQLSRGMIAGAPWSSARRAYFVGIGLLSSEPVHEPLE